MGLARVAQVLRGVQSLPLLRLPVMLSAPPGTRHWSFDGASVDVRLARFPGQPGDVELPGSAAGAGMHRTSSLARGSSTQAHRTTSGHEDTPGVPAEAWVRVSRGVTPAEPYTQGAGGGAGRHPPLWQLQLPAPLRLLSPLPHPPHMRALR